MLIFGGSEQEIAMNIILTSAAINAAGKGQSSYCKFLSAADCGDGGDPEAGIHLSQSALYMFFTIRELRECFRRPVISKDIPMLWQRTIKAFGRITWDERRKDLCFRICGSGVPFLRPEYTGALLVMVKDADGVFENFVFNTDDEIQEFLGTFGMTPAETGRPIKMI